MSPVLFQVPLRDPRLIDVRVLIQLVFSGQSERDKMEGVLYHLAQVQQLRTPLPACQAP